MACRFRIDEFRNTNGYVEYKIQSELQDGSATVVRWHRFSQFDDLIKTLKSEGFKVVAARKAFPSKVRHTKGHERMSALRNVIELLIESNSDKSDPVRTAPRRLLDFLGLTDLHIHSSPDEPTRIDHPVETLPAELCDCVERMIEKLITVDMEFGDDDCDGDAELPQNWEKVNTIQGITSYMNCSDNAVVSKGFIQGSARMAHQILSDSHASTALDYTVQKTRDLDVVNGQTRIQHVISNSSVFFPARDIIIVKHWRVLPETHKIVHVEVALDSYPGVKTYNIEYVRAKQNIGGVVIHQNPDDQTKCYFVAINDRNYQLWPMLHSLATRYFLQYLSYTFLNQFLMVSDMCASCPKQEAFERAGIVTNIAGHDDDPRHVQCWDLETVKPAKLPEATFAPLWAFGFIILGILALIIYAIYGIRII